ncbi:MAG: TldD/PmbA family protein [Caldisericaceae bacterium]
MMTHEQIEDILNRVISLSRANQVEALLMGGDSYLTGFANNYIHRNVGESNYTLSVRVAFGRKLGQASTSEFSDEALASVVKKAEQTAEFQVENPNFISFAKPEEGTISLSAIVDEKISPLLRADYVKKIVEKTKSLGLNGNGKFETGTMQIGVKNSLGVERFFENSQATLKSVVLGENSSGYSVETAKSVKELHLEEIIDESVSIAERGRNPQDIEPGKYEVILTPYALAEFMSHMAYLTLNERAVEDGTSFMGENLGKKVLGDNINIYDDGFSPKTMHLPFDFEGVPKKKVVFFENGYAKEVVYDTLFAYKKGLDSTGHSLPQPSSYSPYPMNIVMEGGDSTKEEMIEHVERGLYVQRFWYTNPMDPRRLIITGMTRDGLFLIEHGKITKPVKNMRFTESIITALNNCVELSKEYKLIYDMSAMTVPFARIKDFTFTSGTNF